MISQDRKSTLNKNIMCKNNSKFSVLKIEMSLNDKLSKIINSFNEF